MRAAGLIAIVVVLGAAATAPAAILRVRPDGTGEFPTIRAAMYAGSSGDTIELADGVFRGYGNRDLVFHATPFTIRSASGNPLSCIIDCQGTANDQHRGFKFDAGMGRDAVLEGVTIRNGCMIGHAMPPHGDESGAAIRCTSASPTIRNCRFVSNNTVSYFASGDGGAVLCMETSSPLFVDCVFLQNHSGLGGGMRCLRCSPVLIDCTFSQNTGVEEGGGLDCWSCQLELVRVVFLDNTAQDGGGLATYAASVHATGCEFEGNSATGMGGAVYLERTSSSVFSACALVGNTSLQSGGGLAAWDANGQLEVTLQDVSFEGNSASSRGGAVYCHNADVDVIGGSAVGCSTVFGGGAYAANGDAVLRLTNVTLTGNTQSDPSALGAGIYLTDEASAQVDRTIIVENVGGAAVGCVSSAAATFVCSDVWGNPGGDWVDCIAGQEAVSGNFSEDPLFCLNDNTALPYALHSDSPCLPSLSPCGELVGAFPEGCEQSSAVQETSWGSIKALYRLQDSGTRH